MACGHDHGREEGDPAAGLEREGERRARWGGDGEGSQPEGGVAEPCKEVAREDVLAPTSMVVEVAEQDQRQRGREPADQDAQQDRGAVGREHPGVSRGWGDAFAGQRARGPVEGVFCDGGGGVLVLDAEGEEGQSDPEEDQGEAGEELEGGWCHGQGAGGCEGEEGGGDEDGFGVLGGEGVGGLEVVGEGSRGGLGRCRDGGE